MKYNEMIQNKSLEDYGFPKNSKAVLGHKDDNLYCRIPRSKDYWSAEVKQMSSIKENAQNYVAPETKNVAELKKVSVDLDIKNKVVNQGTPEEFDYNYIIVDEIEYRVPNIVLKQLKAILEANPDVKHFKVLKDGEGLKTSYLVMVV